MGGYTRRKATSGKTALPAITDKLARLLSESLARHPVPGQLWLGFSGGLDSTVLLHLLACAQVPFTALHIHHGLSDRADQWQVHCADQARQLGVSFLARRVQVNAREGGFEQGARRARYRAFEQAMEAGDQILLAHHGDDQVETFLLRLMRGAGVLGLASMAEQRTLARNKFVLRPLLGASRVELEAYARAQGLAWIEDDSNSDLSIDRNYLRSQVVPDLSARWPVVDRVQQAVENLRESSALLSDLAQQDLQSCEWRTERFGESIALRAFLNLSVARQKNLLRDWLRARGAPLPEASQLVQALAQTCAAEDAQPAVALGKQVLRRYRDRLYLTPQLQPLVTGDGGDWRWDGQNPLVLPGNCVLQPGAGWPVAEYSVRFRCGGERARPRERHHSQTLKKLLQEYGLPPWLRDRVPLIYHGETLVAVGDLFVTAEGPREAPIWRFLD